MLAGDIGGSYWSVKVSSVSYKDILSDTEVDKEWLMINSQDELQFVSKHAAFHPLHNHQKPD